MRNPALRGMHPTPGRRLCAEALAEFVRAFEFRSLRRSSVGDRLRPVEVRCTPSKSFSALAYALAAAGTFLWVGCVLPSGSLLEASDKTDAATPMFRQAHMLVPTLLLLVLLPARGGALQAASGIARSARRRRHVHCGLCGGRDLARPIPTQYRAHNRLRAARTSGMPLCMGSAAQFTRRRFNRCGPTSFVGCALAFA